MKKVMFLAVFLFIILTTYSAFPVLLGVDVFSPYSTNLPAVQFGDNFAEIDLGDVWWGPDIPPIWKVFTTDGNAGLITLFELFHVSGDVPFTDWDEQLYVMDPTGIWVPSPDTDGLVWLGATSNPPGTVTIDEPNDIIIIEWKPGLPPCTTVSIQKDIFVPEGIRYFAVAQWPTVPEPSTLILGGISLLGLLAYKRKTH